MTHLNIRSFLKQDSNLSSNSHPVVKKVIINLSVKLKIMFRIECRLIG